MWIALIIVGIYTWLLKRKKKTVKSNARLLSVFLIVLAMPVLSKAQENKVIISGEITTSRQGKGEIIIFLVDETTFETPLTGIDTVVVKPSKKKVAFKFEPQKKGTYGIRCFHDLNINNKLDKWGWMPKEPYGFSWKTGKKYPFDFDDISFIANTDTFVTIKMEE